MITPVVAGLISLINQTNTNTNTNTNTSLPALIGPARHLHARHHLTDPAPIGPKLDLCRA